MVFHFRLFPGKINDKIFQKMRKTPFLVNFGPIFHTFGQSRTFLILTKYNCANFQKKKTIERIPSNTGFRQNHGRTNMILWDPFCWSRGFKNLSQTNNYSRKIAQRFTSCHVYKEHMPTNRVKMQQKLFFEFPLSFVMYLWICFVYCLIFLKSPWHRLHCNNTN